MAPTSTNRTRRILRWKVLPAEATGRFGALLRTRAGRGLGGVRGGWRGVERFGRVGDTVAGRGDRWGVVRVAAPLPRVATLRVRWVVCRVVALTAPR